jgi:alanyl-tRNA synthetase
MRASGTATERLYYKDAYQQIFEAEVVAKSEDSQTIYLDRSAFYPVSGGQPSDRGELAGIPVIDVHDEDGVVAHVLSAPTAAQPYQAVRGVVDWARRYDFMQQHTGQHLLSAVIEDVFKFPTVSVHLGDETSTIELASEGLSDEQVKRAEQRCLELIGLARPVAVTFEDAAAATALRKPSDRTGTLRIVSIEGVDHSACGGTHVRSLAEIGFVSVRRIEKIRGNSRLEFVAGGRALNRSRQDYRLLVGMSRTCGVAVDDLAGHVAALQQRTADAEKRLQRLIVEAAKRTGAELFKTTAPGPDGIRRFFHEGSSISEEARVRAQAFVEEGNGIALILGTDQNAVLVACGAATGLNAGSVLKQAIAAAGGKGGGSATLAQGSLTTTDGVAALKRSLGVE